ncbi:hypothetical protein SAMN02910369_02229 [Lachnospiraceae bacterium NE2001]|nr:hypothetical protein SAMN02910369_02229 [Lachnospiraceae bacterium NE2001]
MNEKIKNETPDVALELDKLNQVSGGTGKLEELVTRIKADGHAKELRDLLKTQGKPAACAKCCEYYPELSGFAGAAVTML